MNHDEIFGNHNVSHNGVQEVDEGGSISLYCSSTEDNNPGVRVTIFFFLTYKLIKFLYSVN